MLLGTLISPSLPRLDVRVKDKSVTILTMQRLHSFDPRAANTTGQSDWGKVDLDFLLAAKDRIRNLQEDGLLPFHIFGVRP